MSRMRSLSRRSDKHGNRKRLDQKYREFFHRGGSGRQTARCAQSIEHQRIMHNGRGGARRLFLLDLPALCGQRSFSGASIARS